MTRVSAKRKVALVMFLRLRSLSIFKDSQGGDVIALSDICGSGEKGAADRVALLVLPPRKGRASVTRFFLFFSKHLDPSEN